MDIYPLRSPLYVDATAPSTGTPVTCRLTINIDSTLRYTIEKPCTANDIVYFEIAELIRDYLQVPRVWKIASSVLTAVGQVEVTTIIIFLNASGTQVGATNSYSFNAFDGYSEWEDGANSKIPSGASSAFLLSRLSNNLYEMWAPPNSAINIMATDTSDDMIAISNAGSGTSDSTYIYRSSTLNINVVDCSKYRPTLVYFINKLGAIQPLWFFTKLVETVSAKGDTFQRNIIDLSGTTPTYFAPKFSSYPTYPHQVKTYNKNGQTSYKLSSGYYPERANTYFEELLMSEYVWIVLEIPDHNGLITRTVVPVTIKTSNMVYKTSLNDKLIEYSFEFTSAFDYINNVR